MDTQTITQSLAYISWTLLLGMGLGMIALVAVLQQATDATKGFLGFTAVCAALSILLALIVDDRGRHLVRVRGADPARRARRHPRRHRVGRRCGRGRPRRDRLGGRGAPGSPARRGAPRPRGGDGGLARRGHPRPLVPRDAEDLRDPAHPHHEARRHLFLAWTATGIPGGPPFGALTGPNLILVWLRLIVGLVFPLVLAVMAHKTALTRSMESATGLLYIELTLVLASTIVAAGLALGTGLLV
jgi:hypothetical protein